MKRRPTSLILGGVLGGALLLGAPEEAHATNYNGYVCSVVSTSDGTLAFSIYSGADCTGSFVKSFTVCPLGSDGCTGSEFTTTGRDFVHRGLMHAITYNVRVEASDFSPFSNTALNGLKLWAN